jgi:hypothetical protein
MLNVPTLAVRIKKLASAAMSRESASRSVEVTTVFACTSARISLAQPLHV